MKHNFRSSWTDDEIKNNIIEAMSILDIDTMPTSKDIRNCKICGLDSAITRSYGYDGWAKKLNLKSTKCSTRVGGRYEEVAIKMIQDKSYSVKRMGKIHPYDLLVNKAIKIDVKVAMPTGGKYKTWVFNLKKRYASCDIYLLYKLSEEKKIIKTYLIPSSYVPVITLTIGNKSRYDKFIDRWDYIEQFNEFYKKLA